MSIDSLRASLADRYTLERELGQGGMATVYLAHDLKHKRKVAIKILKPELAAVLGAERFVQEITTTAALQHPHILPLFDSGAVVVDTARGDPAALATLGGGGALPTTHLYYVMPFIDGETLRAKLDRETQLGLDEAIGITADVADALEYAHSQGVIHRDIKPENILLANGRPMVADFGIALAVSAAAGGRMTETGLSLGTPHYMSPEQATAEKEITGRSDIYSLASVCYEMLAGQPPHLGGSAQQIIMKIIAEPAQPVTQLRRSVPGHVAAALATALEKLPADRFATAKSFKEALRNPGYTAANHGANHSDGVGTRRWVTDPRSLAVSGVAAVALAAAGWQATRPVSLAPTAYDVGLPDSAAIHAWIDPGLAVAPSGQFVVYQSESSEGSALWYRSLLDATTRRIDGTLDGVAPAISPDERRLAFLRQRGQQWSLEVVPLDGGEAVRISEGSGGGNQVAWLADGRIRMIENDGKLVKWFDPGGGTATSRPIMYCILASAVEDSDALLCGGGGEKTAYMVSVEDSSLMRALRTAGPAPGPVVGSHFRIVDERDLIYLSIGGDLLAAPVDPGTGVVGKSVRMITGLARRSYTGAGAYGLSATGTLVYAQGENEALGYLVQAGDAGMDTVDVGRAPFLRWNLSPDGQRLAAVVEALDGDELRIYDLATGRHVVLARHPEIRQPVWNPSGDQLLFSSYDTVFIARPGQATPPERVLEYPGGFEGFTWLPDGRVIGTLWTQYRAVILHADQRPVTIDSLRDDVTFIRASPDGRWISYSDRAITQIWLEPLPRDGRIFSVAATATGEPQWITSTRLATSAIESANARIEIFDLDLNAASPVGRPTTTHELPGFNDTAGQSFTVTPDGRVLYVQGARDRSARYLRVIPNWVQQMKSAVDEANP
ncbi:MAG: protein kinase [Gemmatimonadales bacterium]|nr:protein kinase [Gemmatimonadales bacterium]